MMMRKVTLVLIGIVLSLPLCASQAAPEVEWITTSPLAITALPALFFTDIESGPNSGGQDNLGTFITLWGEGFGATRGTSTVTIGGHEVARYVIWGADNALAHGQDMIVVQPGSTVTTGNIIVTVNGQASNPLPFTVRSGQIYFVIPGAANAADTNPGTYTEPFKTLYRPRQVMQAGDIVYIKGGTFSAADPEHPGWDAILLLAPDTDPNGTADRPIAYIGYPGDRPVLGAPQPMRRGIYMDEALAYYIIANWEFGQYMGTLELSGNGHRIVGNYSHDLGENPGVIGIAGNSAHFKIFGNLLRDNGGTGDSAGHGLYIQGFGTNQDIDFGWNQIQDQRGRRAIQLFGHVDGDRMDNIRIHDNLILGSLRDNILLGGSDGSTDVLGTISVYNNIIVGADWQGLRINDPQGTVIIQNNVLYNNGSQGPDGNAQLFIERAGVGRITLQNNILHAESGQTYYQFGTGVDSSVFNAANHNLVYNAGACPVWDTGCVNADPLFVSVASADFRPQAQSPAIDAGVNTGISRDYAGVSRPQGGAYDIGAYEYVTATTGLTTAIYLPLILRAGGAPIPTSTPTATPTAISTPIATPTATSTPGADNPNPPASPVKLVFVHHSTGGNWLADPAGNELGGGLGYALMNNNYFVSATNYGWTVAGDTIGDRTDIGNWWEWFRSPDSAAILAALYVETSQNFGDYGSWPRLATDPGGENQVVVIKSCFPNSALQGDPGAAPPPIGSNPLRGQDASSQYHTVANAKGIYTHLSAIFAHPLSISADGGANTDSGTCISCRMCRWSGESSVTSYQILVALACR